MAAGLRPASRPRTVGKPRRSDASTRRQAGWLAMGSGSLTGKFLAEAVVRFRRDTTRDERICLFGLELCQFSHRARHRSAWVGVVCRALSSGEDHGEFMGSVRRRKPLIGGSRLIPEPVCVRPDASARRSDDTDARCAALCVDTYGGGRLGGPSIKGPFSLLVAAGWHVRRKALLPSVKKLGQEIKGRFESLATGFFTTRSDWSVTNSSEGIVPFIDEDFIRPILQHVFRTNATPPCAFIAGDCRHPRRDCSQGIADTQGLQTPRQCRLHDRENHTVSTILSPQSLVIGH